MSYSVNAEAMRKDLESLKSKIVSGARQVLGSLATYALAKAKATKSFKDRTGNLRGSLHRGQKSTWSLFVKAGGNGARYAKFVEEGTRPHRIKARRAKMLKFEQHGEVVFRRSVFHPGTKPARFMQSARDESEQMAEVIIEKNMNVGMK